MIATRVSQRLAPCVPAYLSGQRLISLPSPCRWLHLNKGACRSSATTPPTVPTHSLLLTQYKRNQTPVQIPVNIPAASTTTPIVNPLPSSTPSSDPSARYVYLKGIKPDGRSKRFYKQIQVLTAHIHTAQQAGQHTSSSSAPSSSSLVYAIQLDGRWLVTQYNSILYAPTHQLAMAIALEWDTQGEYIRPASMPLVSLCWMQLCDSV